MMVTRLYRRSPNTCFGSKQLKLAGHLATRSTQYSLALIDSMRGATVLRPLTGCTRIRIAYHFCPALSNGRTKRYQTTSSRQPYNIDGRTFNLDSHSNTPPSILSKLDRKLLHVPSHPLSILRNIVESHFSHHIPSTPSSPIVTVAKNFDELGFAADHPGRALSDSYYLNKEYMLRTHTSAHEVEEYSSGKDAWVLSADVYRRDEIDKSHYPVFHQMEGTHVWPTSDLHTLPELNAALAVKLAECPLVIEDPTQISESNPYQAHHDPVHAAQITQHLKHSLNSLIFRLFGPIATKDGEPLRIRWIEAFFPFTTPSYEVEVWWNGQWLELLGCGVVMQHTLNQAGTSTQIIFRISNTDHRCPA
jgi:phenylalanyl-tRNA synthetase alpha chain